MKMIYVITVLPLKMKKMFKHIKKKIYATYKNPNDYKALSVFCNTDKGQTAITKKPLSCN